jgi:hypothetical protein
MFGSLKDCDVADVAVADRVHGLTLKCGAGKRQPIDQPFNARPVYESLWMSVFGV